MPEKAPVTAALIIIGNEVLSGRTQDANIQYMAKRLVDLGIRLVEVRIVPDDEGVIVDTLNAVRAGVDYVFTTGGIGPTHDDITASCVAKAFGVPLLRNPGAVALLRSNYADPDHELNEARLRMANIPDGATLIANPVSKAPGFHMGNVFVMAGVPRIMQAMFDGLTNDLVGGAVVHSKAIYAFIPEGEMAGSVADLQTRHPDVEIGSYPFVRAGRFGATIVLRSPDTTAMDAAAQDLRSAIRHHGADPIEEDQPI
jgi:molybdenum cofactor synthesis domain-containing protein